MLDQSKATDALAALDAIETNLAKSASTDSEFVSGCASFCKEACFDDSTSDYLVKYARSFESYTDLSTEDLVKRALNRFLKERNTDSILKGINKKASDDTSKCFSTLCMLSDCAMPEDTDSRALLGALEKRAFGLGGLGARAIGGFGNKALSKIAPSFMGGLRNKVVQLFGGGAGQAGRVAGAVGGAGRSAMGGIGKALGFAGAGYGAAKAPEWVDQYGPAGAERRGRQAAFGEIAPMLMQMAADQGRPELVFQALRQSGHLGDLSQDQMDAMTQALIYARNRHTVPNVWG